MISPCHHILDGIKLTLHRTRTKNHVLLTHQFMIIKNYIQYFLTLHRRPLAPPFVTIFINTHTRRVLLFEMLLYNDSVSCRLSIILLALLTHCCSLTAVQLMCVFVPGSEKCNKNKNFLHMHTRTSLEVGNKLNN
jgi:hypothetical protein